MRVSEITESAYPSNVGIMELVQFYKIASDSEKQAFDQLMRTNKLSAAWKLIQQVTGTKLQGMEFESILEKLSKVGEQWALVSKKDHHQSEHKVNAFEDIPRNQMPQIGLQHIKGNYKFKQGLIDISKIKPVQSERTAKDTAGARKSVSNGKAKPIILDRDGHIVNGHHRYDAYLEQGYSQIPVIKVDATLSELMQAFSHTVEENFADGKVRGKSRPGRVKRAGASCKGSVTDLRKRAKTSSGEKAKMYHWCANMKSGRK